ncbi:MAG: rRNA maturation RNase YbeY [Anaerolineae bacterium]
MDEQLITISIDEPFEPLVAEEMLRSVVQRTLLLEGWPSAELTVLVTDDETVCQLNRDYRGLDEPTDVLSFSAQEMQPDAATFVSAPEMVNYLGDVIIAYPVAAAQAPTFGRSVVEELALLAVHGALHLLGYDHGTPGEEEVMWAKQAAILNLA